MKQIITLVIFLTTIVDVKSQNLLDNYLSGTPSLSTIASSANGVSQPRDLDFKPNSLELWVALKGGNNGGSHVIIYSAGEPNQLVQYRKDSHSDHFNHTTSALAFSDIGEFATVAEVKPTNGTFMGPSLWSSDTSIFARAFQNNWVSNYPLGSHLDMLHQSPYSMGVAHDSAKIYWVFDGYNGNICKYDYVSDHSPGYDNHSAGKIWRYTGVSVSRVPGIPSHMVMDKQNKWLYFIDGGSKTLKRLKTTSGNSIGNLNAPNELLSGYFNMGSTALVETIETFTGQPCGVDYFNNRLIVSNYTSGDITVYNTSGSSLINLGKISTGQAGIMGVKIGPDGKIWYVNYLQNSVVKIETTPVADDASIKAIISPISENYEAKYYSPYFNVCDQNITPSIVLHNSGSNNLTNVIISTLIDGNQVSTFTWTGSLAPAGSTTVGLSTIPVTPGRHKLSFLCTAPNGTIDTNPANNMLSGAFRIIESVDVPFFEDFTQSTFPPSNWDVIGFNKHSFISRSAQVGAFGSNSGSLKMGNFTVESEINVGQIDYAVLPELNLENAVSEITLEFSLAHAKYNFTSNDQLKVLASTDCGETWSTIYHKSANSLSTAPITASPFVPQDSEWRIDTVALDQFAGKRLVIMFTFISGSGNEVYIDDVSVKALNTTGVAINEAEEIHVFPNPAQKQISVSLLHTTSNESLLALYDVSGRQVYSSKQYSNRFDISLPDLSSGVYILEIAQQNTTLRRKIVIQ